MTTPEPKRSKTPVTWSWLVALPFLAMYIVRWDATNAITYWPSWFFATPVLLGCVVARAAGARPFKVALPWILLACLFWDSPFSFFRFPYSVGDKGESIRIISLNCAIGNLEAISEALALQPDLLLLQESPSEKELVDLAKANQMKLAFGIDCSILGRGSLELLTSESLSHTWAYWEFGDMSLRVCSLRFSPPLMRFDLWNPATWSAYAEDYRMRRRQFTEVMTLESGVDSVHYIVAGDFNCGPDVGVEGSTWLEPKDAFLVAGRGWGGTGTNDYPLVRVDRVLVNFLDVQAAWSVKTKNSDHRMVVVDIKANDSP